MARMEADGEVYTSLSDEILDKLSRKQVLPVQSGSRIYKNSK